MFYEGIGRLLSETSNLLAAGAGGSDERAQRAQRAITVFLRRLGAVWPRVFSALRDEIAVLEQTLAQARTALAAHGLESRPEAPGDDPVAHYGALQRELDHIVVRLHQEAGAAWAAEALREIRRGLACAAEIQGRVVDEMLAS